MHAQFVHNGKSIDYTPSADVSAGDIVIQGKTVGVAKLDIAANELGALATTGVFDVTKASGDGGIAVGVNVYWNVGGSVATTTAAGNIPLGKCIKAAGDTDTDVRVLIGQAAANVGAAIADLGQTISAAYVQAEAQAISDKVDAILAVLRTLGIIASS